MKVAFIIGSPRSGTTILENILNGHPDIAEWYEPYYLWGNYFSNIENDIWPHEQLTSIAKKRIRREFETFSRRSNKLIVLDKSPAHVFNIEIIQSIFPDAKWIHILRDGRDVTLSIHKEWVRRKEIVVNKDFGRLFRVAREMLHRQPFWKYRLMAILYEFKTSLSIRPSDYLNKSKWQGQIGWGPRFANWYQFLQTHSELEFNAMQWVRSVEFAHQGWSMLDDHHKIELRYEDLLNHTEETLTNILATLDVKAEPDFFKQMPALKHGNFNKWKQEFSVDQINAIKPILAPLIEKFGYARDRDW
jgi:hypothetical protein